MHLQGNPKGKPDTWRTWDARYLPGVPAHWPVSWASIPSYYARVYIVRFYNWPDTLGQEL